MTNEVAGPVRHATMRERNLAVVLGEVLRNQPVTRARLAEVTGFTKTTVSNLLAVLAEAGLVRDGDLLHAGGSGRPGIAVSLDGDGAAALGLEINVDYLSACVLDLARRVRYRHTIAADNRNRPPAEVIDALAELARQALSAADEQRLHVAGTTVALPGLLDRDSGLLRRAPNLGWRDVPIGDLLQQGLPPLLLPTGFDNEANLAALGELWFGAGPDLGDFIHVSGEIGIGAGIVVEGRLFRGAHGFAGELGHLVVAPDGPSCSCGGRGCLEKFAGQQALLSAVGKESVSDLLRLLDTGDSTALDAVTRAGKALGSALVSAVNLLDPDTIALGGLFTRLAPWIQSPLEQAISAGSGTLQTARPRIVISALEGGAAVLGAAGLVIERVIAAPALLVRPAGEPRRR